MTRARRVTWIEPSVPGVAAAALDGPTKRAVWDHIRRADPALAAAITQPGPVHDLVRTFGASPVVTADFIREAKAHADRR